MFIITDVKPVDYSDPWKISYSDRLSMLNKGQQRVVYYYESPDNSTFRYRVYNMIQALNVSKQGISATYITRNEVDYLSQIVDFIDVLVVCRSRYDDKLGCAITKARHKGKRVFFDIDDLVFSSEYVHLILNTLDQDLKHPDVWDFWFAYTGRIGMMLNLCDGVITTNEYLANIIRQYSKKSVFVIPNFLNRQQMDISNRIFNEKSRRKFARDGQIHLGYFSGTPTHNKDFEIISQALSNILETNPHVTIRVVGYLELKGMLRNYRSRIEFYSLHDFVNLQRQIGLVEVNLVPLQDNIFTNSKSELKYFEAGIVGTLTIATPVFTYAGSIQDGDNSYLAKSFEWEEKITNMINSLDVYHKIAERAFNDCERKFAWYNQVSLVEQVLFK